MKCNEDEKTYIDWGGGRKTIQTKTGDSRQRNNAVDQLIISSVKHECKHTEEKRKLKTLEWKRLYDGDDFISCESIENKQK